MSELVCKRSYLAVIGCILQDPNLLYDLDKPLEQDDFNTEPFYKLIFTALYNLYNQGCANVDEFTVDSYLSNYPEQYKIFTNNDGIKYLSDAKSIATLSTYDYFYHRLRKYSLLRYYEEHGYDVKRIFDYTIGDPILAEKEQSKLDSLTEDEIIGFVEAELTLKPRSKYCSTSGSVDIRAGQGMKDLIYRLMEIPDIGLPLNSPALNTVARGARKGCLYMRSSKPGGGKSRMAAADACRMAVPYFWDLKKNEWVYTGFSEPTLYITTEMEAEEIQTLLIAIISGVDEDHIKEGAYKPGELERVLQATEYIEQAPLFIKHMPDFDIDDVKNACKTYHREHDVDYVFFDYIHTSLKLMSQIGKSTGMKMREDQMLLVFATELKSLCQQLNIFMMTASQLSGDYENATYKDQQLLAGAKALANKLDVGMICMPPTKAEQKKLEKYVSKRMGCPQINMLTWIYKVRSGKLTRIIICSHYDMSNMRIQDAFVTNFDFELINMDFTQIETIDAEEVEKVIRDNSIDLRESKEDNPDVQFDAETGEILEENTENVGIEENVEEPEVPAGSWGSW